MHTHMSMCEMKAISIGGPLLASHVQLGDQQILEQLFRPDNTPRERAPFFFPDTAAGEFPHQIEKP